MKKFIIFPTIIVFLMYPLSAAHAKQTLEIKGRLGKKVLEFRDSSGKVVDRLKGDGIKKCKNDIYLVCDGKIKKRKEENYDGSGYYTITRSLECKKYRYYWADRYAREFKPLHKSSFQDVQAASCPVPGNLFKAKKGGKWGFLRLEDRLVGNGVELRLVTAIPFELDVIRDGSAYPWESEIAVKKGEKWGFINEEGNRISDFIFDEVGHFYEGMADVKMGGKWGFINEKGNRISDFIFEEVWPFSEGMAFVKMGGKWGFINEKGNMISDFIFESGGSFSEGMASVKMGRMYGYINKKGSVVIKPRFLNAGIFMHETKEAQVEIFDKSENRVRIHKIDLTGKEVSRSKGPASKRGIGNDPVIGKSSSAPLIDRKEGKLIAKAPGKKAPVYPVSTPEKTESPAENKVFWVPLLLENEVKMVYKYDYRRSGQSYPSTLDITFKKRADSKYDLVTTSHEMGKTRTLSEKGIDNPWSWGLMLSSKGYVVPRDDKLPMALTRNLIVSSFSNFYPISRTDKGRDPGFTAGHPARKGASVEVTPWNCSSAGVKGRVVTTTVDKTRIKACISPQIPLPLTFRSEDPNGGIEEYILDKYLSGK